MKLIVKRFQRLFHLQPDLYILFVKLTAQIGDCIWKKTSAYYVWGVWNFLQSLSFFLISWMVTWTLMSPLQSSFTESSFQLQISVVVGKTLCRNKTLSLLILQGRGGGVSSALWASENCFEVPFAGLCMVPCHWCHIYGIWRSRVDALKSSFWVTMQEQSSFYGEEGFLTM